MTVDTSYMNDGFRQTDFVGSLPYIPLKQVVTFHSPTAANSEDYFVAATRLSLNDANFVWTQFANYLSTFNGGTLPQTWDSLINGWWNYFTMPNATEWGLPAGSKLSSYYNAYGGSPQMGDFWNNKSFFTEIVQQFSTSLMNVSALEPGVTGSDWNILGSLTQSTMSQNFLGAFNAFLKNYKYTTVNGVSSVLTTSGDPSSFFNQWYQFTAVTATIQNAQPPQLSADSNKYTQGLPSYESIYYLFHPGATKSQFQQAVTNFYNAEFQANGYFLPSQSINSWYEINQAQFNQSIGGVSPFSSASSEKALILNRLINLLISLISILQKVGVSQANQLKFVTNFQNIYVKLQTQIPVLSRGDTFTAGSGATGTTPLGLKTTSANDERNAINTAFNAAKTEMMRSFRGVQEDIAKQVQSRVNQTNDTVNQQTDMATAFLQQLSGLVGAIFR